jgi:hypothetical protein
MFKQYIEYGRVKENQDCYIKQGREDFSFRKCCSLVNFLLTDCFLLITLMVYSTTPRIVTLYSSKLWWTTWLHGFAGEILVTLKLFSVWNCKFFAWKRTGGPLQHIVTCRPIARERLGRQARNKQATNKRIHPLLSNDSGSKFQRIRKI